MCVFFSKKLKSFDTSVAEHGKLIGEHVHSNYCVEIFEDVGGEGWVAVDCEKKHNFSWTPCIWEKFVHDTCGGIIQSKGE